MRLGKYVLLSLLLLALVACSTSQSSTTHEGNLDAFVQKYPQFKGEIAKLDPDFKSKVVVPLDYPFKVSRIEVSAQPIIGRKSITLHLTVYSKDIWRVVMILIVSGRDSELGTGPGVIKLNQGVLAEYSDNPNTLVKSLMWQDKQNQLVYSMLCSHNVTKDQVVQIANQIIGE